MANRYWVGGTGTWTTTTTNWSATSGGAGGASAPTAADSVFFDQAGTYTVTLTGALTCLDITVSAGTVTFTSTGTIAVSGSMSLTAATVWSATGTLTFNATTTGKTITTNGITMSCNFILNGAGGEWTLGSALTLGVTNTTTLTAGSLVLNGFDITTGTFISSTTNTRSISFGTNFIILRTSTTFVTNLSMSNATNFTWTGTTGGFSTNMSVVRAFAFGSGAGSAANAPNLYITGGANEALITTLSWFNIFDCNGSTSTISGATTGSGTSLNVRSIVLASGGTYTNVNAIITDTGTINGNSKSLASLTINHTGTTTLLSALTVVNTTTFGTTSTPTLDLNGFDLTTASFSASGSGARSVTFGSNFIVTTNSGVSISDATNFTWTGTGGFKGNMAVAQSFVFGTTGGSASNAINLFIYTGAQSASLSANSWFNKLDCTGSTGIVGTTSTTVVRTIYVNTLILASGASAATAYVWLQANMIGTSSTINGQGKSLYTFTIPAGGTTTLSSALGVTTLYTQLADTTLDLAGFTLTASAGFTYTGGTLTMNAGTISTTTFTLDGPTFTLNSGAINPSTSFVLTSGSFTLGALGTLGATTTFTQTAGNVTFAKNYSLVTASNSTYTLTSGTLDLGGFTLNVGRFVSSNSNTRSIAFGSGNIQLSYFTASATNLSMSTATNFSWTGTGGFTADMTTVGIIRIFTFGSTAGGSAANAPNLSIFAGSVEVNITTASWFKTLNFTDNSSTIFGGSGSLPTALNLTNLTLGTGTYSSVSATMVAPGNVNGNNRSLGSLLIEHTGTTTLTGTTVVGSTTTFGIALGSTPTLNLNGFDLTTGSFSSSTSNIRSVTFGSNFIITTASGVSMSIATNFTWTGTGGFKGNMAAQQGFTFGPTGASASNAINLFVYTGAQAAILGTDSWFNKIDCTGSTGIVGTTSVATVKTININTLILASGANATTAYGFLQANMFGANSTINGQGKSINTFTIQAGTTTTLSSSLGCTALYTHGLGDIVTTLDLAGFTLTASLGFTYLVGNILNFGTISTTTFTLNGPTLTLNSGAINCSTSLVITSGAFTLGASGSLGATQTITHTAGSVTFGKSYSLTATGTYTFTSGTLDLGGFTLTTGTFSSSNANTRSIAFGTGNIVLATTTAGAVALSMSTADGFTYTGTGGFTTAMTVTRVYRFGSTSGGSSTNAPNLSFTSGASEILITTTSWFNSLTFTGSTSTVSGATTATTTSLNVNSLTFASGGTYSNITVLTIRGTGTITTAGKTINGSLTINHTGTTTLASALTCLTYTQTSGDVNFATNNLVCSGAIAFTSGTYTNTGTITCTTFTVTGAFVLSNGTLTPSTSITVSSGSFTYTAGTLSAVATFNQTAGNVTLGKAYALTATGTYTLTSGTLDLGGFTLTTGIFSSNNTNTRSILFGVGNIVLATTSAGLVNLDMATATNFTYTGTGGFVSTASVTRTFNFGSIGGSSTIAPNLTFTGSGTAVQSFTSQTYFNKLDFGTTAFNPGTTLLNLNAVTLSSGGTYTSLSLTMKGTGILTSNAKTIATFEVNSVGTVTLAGNLTCNSYAQNLGILDFATFTVTSTLGVTFSNGSMINIGTITCPSFTIAGTFTLTAGTINTTIFVLTSGTFNYNGGTLSTVTSFSHTDGTLNLGANLTIANTGTYTLNGGTVNIAGYVLTTGIFSSSSVSVRSIAFGAGNISLVHPSAGQTVLGMANTTNFTNTGTGGFITDASVTRSFVFGQTGGAFNIAPNLSITSGASVPNITTNSWFKTLDFTGSTCTPAQTIVNVETLILATGGTYTNLTPVFTKTQTWTMQFSKQLAGIGINGLFNTLTLDGTQTYTATSTCYVLAGTLNLGGYDLTVGSISASGTTNRQIIFGNNNIILATPSLGNTVLSIADATNFSFSSVTGGFVSDASVTRTFTFGTTGGAYNNAPNLSITSGSSIPTITTGSWFNKLDFTGSTCTPAATTLNLNNLTLAAGGTYVNLSVTMRSNGTITPNGKTISTFVVNHTDLATTTFAGALICTTQTYTAGNVDFGGFNITSSAGAAYTSGSFSNLGTLTCTTFTVTGTFILDGGTITPSTSIILTSGSITYTSGTLSAVPTFTHSAGTFTLGKAYALTTTGTYTLTSGSLNLAGFNLTTGIFSSSGTTARSIAFGTGNIILATTTAATTNLLMNDATNFTYTGTGGFTAAADITRTFIFGLTSGSVTNAPNLAITSGSAVPTITSGSWFNTLDFTGSSTTPAATTLNLSTLTLSSGGTYTGLIPTFNRTQTWTSQFSKQLGGIGFDLVGGTLTLDGTQTYTATSIATLTNGTLNLGGVNQTFGTFVSSNGNTRSIIFGTNNIILATTSAGAINLSMATATGFTYTGTGGFTAAADITRTFTFGTTGGSTTNALNLTFTGSGTAVQTLTTGSWFNALSFGTTAFNPGTTTLNLNSLTLSSGGTYTTVVAQMVGTGTITSNGKLLIGLTITSAGTTTLNDAATVQVAGGATTLTSGTLNLNGFNLTTGTFSSSNANTRSIAFGTGNIVLSNTTAATVNLSMDNVTNFTYTGTGGFTAAADITRTFRFGTAGGSVTNAPNLSITSGAAIPTIFTGSWFKALNFTGSTCTPATTSVNVDTLTLATGGTYTGLTPIFTRTQTWTAQFSKQLNGIGFNLAGGTLTLDNTQTYTATSTCTLTAGTLDLGGVNLTIGRFSSDNSNTRSIAFGTSNIILATTSVAQTNIDMAVATNFSYTGTGGFTAAADITRTFTFGTTGGSTTNAPNLTLTGSGTAVQTFSTGSWFNKLDFGTTAFNPGTTTLNLNSLTLSGSGVFTSTTVNMIGTGTITSNGNTTLGALVINCPGGTTTLASALSIVATATTRLDLGTLNLAGFTLTTGIFSSSNSGTRSITFGTGNIVLATTTAGTVVLGMATATGFTYTGTGGFSSVMSATRTFTFGTTGGSSTNAPNLLITSGASIPTITTGSWFNMLNFTGSTCIPASTVVNLNSLTLATGGTYTNLNLQMVGTGTITSIAKTIGTLSINHSGTTTLAGALTTGLTITTTLTSGTLDLAGFTLTTGQFSSNNTNTRSISFGTGNIALAFSSANIDNLDMPTVTNFTYTGTGGFTSAMGVTRTFTFGITAGGSAANAPNLSLTSGASIPSITTGSWFKALNFTGTTSTPAATTVNVDTLTLATGGTYTGLIPVFTRTQTWTPQFSKQLGGIGVNGSGVTLTLTATQTYTATSQCLLTAGTLDLGGANLTIGTFSSNNANTRSIVFGANNIVLATTTGGSSCLNMGTATGFTYTGTGGFTSAMSVPRTFSFGSTAGGSTTNAPNLSLTSGASIPLITTGSWFKALNFTGTTSTPTATTINVDTLTLATGGTYTGLAPSLTRTQTWSSQFSKPLAGIGVNGPGVTLTLDATQTYTGTTTLTVNDGTLNTNAQNLSFDSFVSTGTGSRSITGAGTITIANNWTVTSGSGFTGSNYTIKMSKVTPKTFAGAGGTYGTLVQSGAGNLTITGSNTFADIVLI